MIRPSAPMPDPGRDTYSRNEHPPELIVKINAGYNGPSPVPSNVLRPTSPPPPKKKEK
jgi:hypothetical protein